MDEVLDYDTVFGAHGQIHGLVGNPIRYRAEHYSPHARQIQLRSRVDGVARPRRETYDGFAVSPVCLWSRPIVRH